MQDPGSVETSYRPFGPMVRVPLGRRNGVLHCGQHAQTPNNPTFYKRQRASWSMADVNDKCQ